MAAVKTELKPHQQRVVERMRTQPGLVVAHGMGSGKTLTSIATAEDLAGPVSVLVPAALQTNYQKELTKHIAGKPAAQYNIDSIQRQALKQDVAPAKLLIVDEAHRLRDPVSEGRKAVKEAPVEKRMLLTGTPTYNRPYDIASLVNLAAGHNVFPAAQADFNNRYIRERQVDPGWMARTFRGIRPGTVTELKRTEELGKHLGTWVDYHENSTENFPMRKDETVQVVMHPKQREMYEGIIGKAPAWVRYKIRKGLPPSKQESKDINAFANAVRQISNSPGGFRTDLTPEQAAELSPKIQEAYKRLSKNIAENPQHRAVVYSNYLDAGIQPYESLLQKGNIPYGKFTGTMPKPERDRMIADYNAGKLKALLLSSAGGEGLDLKGTRQIQILEPHWNKEKLEQVIARGIRYKSHEHLPEDQRQVAVEHYQSINPEPGLLGKIVGNKRPGAIDEYLTQLSTDKDRLNQQVRDLLKQYAAGSASGTP
jgi:SNF2 family DNA or RNA helicase